MIGEMPVFSNTSSDWVVYTERLEQFFEINDVATEKKKALLLTTIGEDIYKTLRDVCHPMLPKHRTFDELIELLNKQFCIKTSIYRERVKFYNAKQMARESISQWFARLKKLSVDCKFGDQFDAVLLDRFICGLRSSAILDRLCEEEDILTLPKAIGIAINRESSANGDAGPTLYGDFCDGNGLEPQPIQVTATPRKRAYKRKAVDSI